MKNKILITEKKFKQRVKKLLTPLIYMLSIYNNSLFLLFFLVIRRL